LGDLCGPQRTIGEVDPDGQFGRCGEDVVVIDARFDFVLPNGKPMQCTGPVDYPCY
jgi:hypothetical protein